jgi:branched-chain amino acid transport system substrate-binding protein
VVFFSGYYFQTGPALKQAQEMSITDIRFFGEQGSDSVKTAEIAGKAAEGFVILTSLDRDDKREIVQEYIRDYRERAKEEPNMCGASAYDAFMILIDGIKRAGSVQGLAVAKAIGRTQDLDGITGLIHGFNEAGEVLKPVQLQIIQGGQFHYFGVITDEELVKP